MREVRLLGAALPTWGAFAALIGAGTVAVKTAEGVFYVRMDPLAGSKLYVVTVVEQARRQ